MSKPQVAYILWRFPYLTETFIADEISEIHKQGIQVHLYSLLPPKSEPVQPVSEQLLQQGVVYAPMLFNWFLWWAQIVFIVTHPIRYFSLLVQLIRQPYPNAFVTRFSKRCFIFLKAVALAQTIKGSSIQLLHTHFAYLPGVAATVIAELLNLPVTVTIHAYDIYSPNNNLLCLVAKKTNRIVAISEYNKKNVLAICPGLDEQQVAVIHCGINPKLFQSTSHSTNQTLSIISVGSLVEMKGHQHLIRACKILKESGLNFHCQIFGGGPLLETLTQLIEQLEINDVVTLRGACLRPVILEAYKKSDIFILASIVANDGDRDGIPVVLMEAAAMQLPIISTTVSGIPELVQQNVNGLLVSERNSEALAKAVIHLAADEQLRIRFGNDGAKIVEQNFALKGNIAQLANLFRGVVAEEFLKYSKHTEK